MKINPETDEKLVNKDPVDNRFKNKRIKITNIIMTLIIIALCFSYLYISYNKYNNIASQEALVLGKSSWEQMIPDIIIVIAVFLMFLLLLIANIQASNLRKMSKRLAYGEALYQSVFNQVPIGISIADGEKFVNSSDFGSMGINPMFQSILGWTSSELDQMEWSEITHPEDLEKDIEQFQRFKRGEIKGYSIEKRFIKPDGSIIWTNMKVVPFLDNSNSISMHLCLIEDISIQKEAQELLIESNRTKSVLLSNLPGMAYRCKYDRDWTMEFVSDGCYDLTGYSPDKLLNNKELSFNDLIKSEYRQALWNEWKHITTNYMSFRYEYQITTASGDTKWVLEMGEGIYNEKREVEALEGIILDISSKKEMEDILKYNYDHDLLTGLYNRPYLEELLGKDANDFTSENRAIVGINLSSMHLLSLSHGFSYTQTLTKIVADSLKLYCDSNKQLFNTFEYRFLFYVKNYKERDELEGFCQKVANTLEGLFSLEKIGGGIGVVEIDEANKDDIEHLLKDVLIATEKAMDFSETDVGILFFNQDLKEAIIREETIKRELSEIVENINPERLFLLFQPILDLKSNRICAFEALARLNSSNYGLVSPVEFIPLAEKTKLIIPLGERIIRKALLFQKTIEEKGYEDTGVSINISAIQLLKKGFCEKVFELIDEINVNPKNVGIEITESVFASDYEEINRILGELRDFGLKIALDDFGTEYSSLARVSELNVNCLKIDKYFIDKLLMPDSNKTITSHIISMAHKLGHSVIAEGVEYEKQLAYLKEHNCDSVQGYLIGKPLDGKIAIDLLEEYGKSN